MPAPTEMSITPGEALERLAAALDSRDYTAKVMADESGRPYLAVSSRHAQLSEVIYANANSYWWPWGQPIAAVGNPQAAASKISHVLAATPEPAHG